MVLAPMADVTDVAFRSIIAKYSHHPSYQEQIRAGGKSEGGPHVFWTEFVSADGLCHESGREALIKDLAYSEEERPIVAQLFSAHPVNMRQAAKLVAELGFDGLDINMGCPDRTIEKQGAGACMIKTPDIAAAIIQAAKDGIADAGKEIPISVKTRIGYGTNEMTTWIPFLLQQNIALLTVHLRTRRELSSVPAHWEYMKDIVKLRNQYSPETLIFGNGDVVDLADAYTKANETGCDGIMIGRAIFGNPWLFLSGKGNTGEVAKKKPSVLKKFLQKIFKQKDRYWLEATTTLPLEKKLQVMVEHAKLFETAMPHKNFAIMKKHFKAYAHGFPGAKELRIGLMETKNSGEVEQSVKAFLKN